VYGAQTGGRTAQLFLWLSVLLAAVRPFGGYMQRVSAGEATPLSSLLRPIEAALYRIADVRPDHQQELQGYALAFLAYRLPGLLYFLLRWQYCFLASALLEAVYIGHS
jgi:K+-transporting ATPase ATPase A chain